MVLRGGREHALVDLLADAAAEEHTLGAEGVERAEVDLHARTRLSGKSQ